MALSCLALLAAGCGSSDSGSSTSGSGGGTTSRAAFVAKADAICRHGENTKNAALKASLQELGKSNKPLTATAQEELLTTVALPPIQRMVDELGQLAPPEGKESQADAMVAAFEAEIKALEGNPASVVNGSGGNFEKADRMAKAFGMKYCAAI